jgi:HrpA-like RNA helicase
MATRQDQFPIQKHRDEILEVVKNHSEIAISAPTGSGKSLYLPPLFQQSFGGRVRIAIPTTVAVRSAFRFLSQQGYDVGFAAGRVIDYHKNTKIAYGTTGHFSEKLLNVFKRVSVEGEMVVKKLQAEVREVLGDIFIVDEVHAATTQTTTLMGLIRKAFPTSENRPKLIFMTATLNLTEISTFFPNVELYTVEAFSYPIEVIYLNQDSLAPKSSIKDVFHDDPTHEVVKIVRAELDRFVESGEQFHIIVFRPGIEEVGKMTENLQKSFSPSDPIRFFQAHSRLLPEEIDDIFVHYEGVMKVVVGTNIVESSITIPSVGVIIDDCLVKSAETSSIGGQKLQRQYVSQAEGRQRAGRTGRTIPGRAYRLCEKHFWELLPLHPKREIDRVPIFQTVLRFITVGLDSEEILMIPKSRVKQAEGTLLSLGMLEVEEMTEKEKEEKEARERKEKEEKEAREKEKKKKEMREKKSDSESDNESEEGSDDVSSIWSEDCLDSPIVQIQPGQKLKVTEIGHFVAGVPLSIQNAMMIYLARDQMTSSPRQFQTVLAVAVMLECFDPGYFWTPTKAWNEDQSDYTERRSAHIERYHEQFRGETDIHTLVNIFWSMISYIETQQEFSRQRLRDHFVVKDFAQVHSMNNKTLQQMLITLHNVEEFFDWTRIREAPVDYTVMGDFASRIFAKAYIHNKFTRERKGRSYYGLGNCYQIDNRVSFNKIKDSPRLVAARTMEIMGKKGSFRVISLVVSDRFIEK